MSEEAGPIARLFESPGLTVFGAIADVAAVIVLLNVSSVKTWVARNPEITILLIGAVFLAAIVLFDRWRVSNAVNKQLEGRLMEAEVRPKLQDIERFKVFVDDFGLESAHYLWLHEGFVLKSATGEQLNRSCELFAKWDRDPSNYIDKEVAAAFTNVKDALEELNTKMLSNFFPPLRDYDDLDESQRRYSIPFEWDGDKRDESISSIRQSYAKLMKRYDVFFCLATDRGMGS